MSCQPLGARVRHRAEAQALGGRRFELAHPAAGVPAGRVPGGGERRHGARVHQPVVDRREPAQRVQVGEQLAQVDIRVVLRLRVPRARREELGVKCPLSWHVSQRVAKRWRTSERLASGAAHTCTSRAPSRCRSTASPRSSRPAPAVWRRAGLSLGAISNVCAASDFCRSARLLQQQHVRVVGRLTTQLVALAARQRLEANDEPEDNLASLDGAAR